MTPIELSENHRRTISISLQLLDEALCEWSDWTDGRMRAGVMYCELDTLSHTQRHDLREKIESIRRLIIRLRDDLHLPTRDVATSRSIAGHASLLWEMLTELNSRALRAYGTVPEPLARYLDPIGETLSGEMSSITAMLAQARETAT